MVSRQNRKPNHILMQAQRHLRPAYLPNRRLHNLLDCVSHLHPDYHEEGPQPVAAAAKPHSLLLEAGAPVFPHSGSVAVVALDGGSIIARRRPTPASTPPLSNSLRRENVLERKVMVPPRIPQQLGKEREFGVEALELRRTNANKFEVAGVLWSGFL